MTEGLPRQVGPRAWLVDLEGFVSLLVAVTPEDAAHRDAEAARIAARKLTYDKHRCDRHIRQWMIETGRKIAKPIRIHGKRITDRQDRRIQAARRARVR